MSNEELRPKTLEDGTVDLTRPEGDYLTRMSIASIDTLGDGPTGYPNRPDTHYMLVEDVYENGQHRIVESDWSSQIALTESYIAVDDVGRLPEGVTPEQAMKSELENYNKWLSQFELSYRHDALDRQNAIDDKILQDMENTQNRKDDAHLLGRAATTSDVTYRQIIEERFAGTDVNVDKLMEQMELAADQQRTNEAEQQR